jgi:signal transduction histidine kinase
MHSGWPELALGIGLALLAVAALVNRLQNRANAERTSRVRAERHSHLSDSLQQVAAAVSRAKTGASVVEAAIPEFLHAFNASAGALLLVSDDGTSCEIAKTVGCGEPTEQTPPFPLMSYPPLADAVRRHEITFLEGPRPRGGSQEPIAALEFIASQESAVAIPLITGGRAVAMLAMSFRNARKLAPDEIDLLLKSGRRTAEALVRANAYDAAERARASAEDYRSRADRELRERQKAQAALRESEIKYRALAARTSRLYVLSAALSESSTIDAVAAAIVRHGKIVVGASAASVALLTPEGDQFETRRGDRFAEQPGDPGDRFPAERGLCATAAVETKKPVFVGSFDDFQERFWRSASIAADGGFASAAILPLIVEDCAVGVVAFHFTAPVHFDDEYIALLISVAQHCTQALDRARLYEGAQRARTDAELANRSKDDFLSTVSHELRTPLTAVLGWAALLRRGTLDPARTSRAIEAIYNNATRQAQLIDELLDISRIVSGRAVLDVEELDLSLSIRGAVEAVMPMADNKGLELRLGSHPAVPVLADPRRLEQILLNLLSNAVKFTAPGGHVSVNVAVSQQVAEVRVSDDGSGIDADFLPHVFERFRQGENTTARSVSGLGLGLFITRQLVEAQGGLIRAESRGPGQGSTFVVTLPIAAGRGTRERVPQPDARALSESAEDVPPTLLYGIRVLLVDDEADVRELMTAALERAGATVVSVDSAAAALHVVTDEDIDVLLADIAMPVQDGYDLIRAVRGLPVPRAANVRAAAVTACARDDERQRALAAGFQLHLTKPLQPGALVHAVARLVLGPAVTC